MVKRNAIATKLTKRCTQTQKRAFDVAVLNFGKVFKADSLLLFSLLKELDNNFKKIDFIA